MGPKEVGNPLLSSLLPPLLPHPHNNKEIQRRKKRVITHDGCNSNERRWRTCVSYRVSFFLSFFFFALNSSSVIHLYIILNDFFCDVPSPCLFFSSGARSLDALGSPRKEVKGKRKLKE